MNRKEILQVCEKELALSRAKAQNLAYNNLQQAMQSQEYASLEKEERALVYEIGKLKAFKQNYQNKQTKLEEIRENKIKALQDIGLTKEDLQPKYSCKNCNDIGYKNSEMCSCLKTRINQLMIKESGAGKEQLNDFSNFNADIASKPEHKEQLLKLKKKFEIFADNYPKNTPHFIVLSGKAGVGKTFLTECLAKSLIDKGYLVSFISAFGMNNMFLAYHTTFNEEKQNCLNPLLDPDVLVIDDLGTEPILKNVTKEYLHLLLSERAIANKLTIVTTNLEPLQTLARYNERIFSRLFNKRDSFLSQIIGSDLRISNKK